MTGKDEISITKNEANSLRDFIEMNFFDTIRADTDIDRMSWAANIVHIWEKCRGVNKMTGEAGKRNENNNV